MMIGMRDDDIESLIEQYSGGLIEQKARNVVFLRRLAIESSLRRAARNRSAEQVIRDLEKKSTTREDD